jgi:type VI secretion system secreted protein Hcp
MAFDSFIKIGDIPGESTEPKDWIQVESFHWGATQPVNMKAGISALTGGGVNLSEFSFVKKVDKASPKLFVSCCKGDPIAKIEFQCQKSVGKPQVYLKYTFENAMISSVRPGGSSHGSDDVPLEEVSFAFTKFESVYTPLDEKSNPQGNVSTSFNLAKPSE